jgi:hypothetical protein
MAFMITHFYEGGTAEQYRAVVDAVHPPGGLPAGQVYHAAGPTEGGWLVVAVWDSRDSFDRFATDDLMPALERVTGGFDGPPQQRTAEVANLLTA